METITIPKLYCPFSSEINPNVEKVKEHTDQWVLKFNLRENEHLENYYNENYSYLTSRFYPKADYPELCIANDFITLLFFIDDRLEDPFGESNEDKELAVKGFIKKLMMIVRQEISLEEREDNLIFEALKDIWKRVLLLKNDVWASEFINEINNLFDAVIWESENITQKRIPETEEYLGKRRFLAAANIAHVFIAQIEKIHLPISVKENSIIQEINELAGTIIGISNDLFSLSKEQISGHTHNIAPILMFEKNIELKEAILLSVEIHNKKVEEFMLLCDRLPRFETDIEESVQRYTGLLKTQLAGNLTWSVSETSRYDFIYEGAGHIN